MKVKFTKGFPPGNFRAINILTTLFFKDRASQYRLMMCRRPSYYFKLIEHERWHSVQMRDLLGLLFYVWYFIEWLFKLFTEGKAYKQLSFEREARYHESDHDEYDVYVKISEFLLPLYKAGEGLNSEISKLAIDNIDKIKFLEFVPKKQKGALLKRKWGSWLKFVFHNPKK